MAENMYHSRSSALVPEGQGSLPKLSWKLYSLGLDRFLDNFDKSIFS